MASGAGAEWIVLGAGSILPRAGFGPAGYALRPRGGREVLLFDCGPGTVRSLDGAGISLADVRAVCVTHFHLDHWLDLPALSFARRNPRFEGLPPLELVAPRGLARRLASAAEAFGRSAGLPDARVREVPHPRGVVQIEPLGAFPGVHLACAPTHHTDTSLAWRAGLDGVSVTFSGDAVEGAELVELARGTSLFVCECSGTDADPMPGHLTATSAARMAAAAGVGRLLLTHFYPHVDPPAARVAAARCYDGPIELASDGCVVRLEPSR